MEFNSKLESLKNRRQGTVHQVLRSNKEKYSLSTYSLLEKNASDLRESENYERLNEPDVVKYIIGAMQPVPYEDTRSCYAQFANVSEKLENYFSQEGLYFNCKLQGSLPLDIHVKKYSDIDILFLGSVITVQQPCLYPYKYKPSSYSGSMESFLGKLRELLEDSLGVIFFPSKVNTSGNKSITLSEGEFNRKIDIVPSHWHDTLEYQKSNLEEDRAVNIYNKKSKSLTENFPFKHIKLVNEKDKNSSGNLKKAIRLLKNIVYDSENFKDELKALSSFDLTSICYQIDDLNLVYDYNPLEVVHLIYNELIKLYKDDYYRESVNVPDKTRAIFNNFDKYKALLSLCIEVGEIQLSLYKQLNPKNQNSVLKKFIKV